MEQMTGLDFKLGEIAGRIRELREIEGLTAADMAKKTAVSEEEYLACENGRSDLNFAFIYRCALAFGVDVTDIIEGQSPNLKSYTVTRRGEGQRIEKAHGMTYYNLAASFKNRIAEPLYVKSVFSEEAQHRDIELTTHTGQECDLIIEGKLKVQVGEHKEVLGPGDSIYYDSSTPHGMIAVDGKDCIFYAIVLNPTGEPIPELTGTKPSEEITPISRDDNKDRIYRQFIDITENENGTPLSIKFKNTERFNFAFDLVDALADKDPEKLAMLHIDKNKVERRFTFNDMKRASNQCANYFKSLGIKKGDRVMLVLKRHYQFWYAILALHKLGAVAIPATNLLQEHDFDYRFNAAEVSAIVCTADGDVAHQVDLAEPASPTLKTKILVGGEREGWHNFDEEFPLFSAHFYRTEDTACGDDLMLMFFTSGTTGYPKIAAHNYKYALGHYVTAKYWHGVDENGLHFTISDTGWGKALWGKLYGQWMCEAPIFTYDFDNFDAKEILHMIEKYKITTFCAPPTVYRVMVHLKLDQYDLSSLQNVTTAGEALNPEIFEKFKAKTGLTLMEGFGQTETTLTIGNLVGTTPKPGSMGVPTPQYDVQIMLPDGTLAGPEEEGEIVICTEDGAPNGLFMEYYGDEEKTQNAWHDGYYHTGDTAYFDEDGYLWYVGRTDDVIKSSGYRIGPFEIENEIMKLPYVLECAVTSVPDPIRGQAIKASIVLANGEEGTDKLRSEIMKSLKKNIASYKWPKILDFTKELPKTISGKIRRKEIKENDWNENEDNE